MVESREILLKLVRLALGWERDFSLPESVNWKEVLELASEQGVSAIILDGYEVFLKNNPGVKSFLSLPENKPLKGVALGNLNNVELTYQKHVSALTVLSDTLDGCGIPFLVLKGFSCAQFYPIPSHRKCGDIDIFPGDRFEESNQALKAYGIDVDPHYYRHSVSEIKGVMIENHRILCDLRGPRKQTRALEKQLEQEAKKSLQEGRKLRIQGQDVSGAICPSANFNALFLPWHVSAHFELESVTIRHLLDWALFLTKEGKDIDVALFRKAKRDYTYGYSKFADILTALAIEYLKMPIGDIPNPVVEDAYNTDGRLVGRVFDYMFEGQPRERDINIWKFRLKNVRRIWTERWKFRDLYGMSVFSFLFYKIIGVLFKVGDDD